MRGSALFAMLLVACGAADRPEPAKPAADGCPRPAQSPDELLAGHYESKMISRGDNRPSVNLVDRQLDLVSVLLHHHVPADEIRRHFHWTEADYASRLQQLLDEGLAKQDRCGPTPTAMVISRREGARLYDEVDPIAHELAAMIAAHLPELERRFATLGCSRSLSFAQASFVIVSDGLLDDGQIGAVEQRFLGVERTARHGKHYYEAFLERAPGVATEAFGIYGNATQPFGSVMVGLYGNARDGRNFMTLTAADLARDFEMPTGADPTAYRATLAAELAAAAFDAAPAAHLGGFATLGLVRDGRVAIPAFHGSELPILEGMAGVVLPELLAILERHRSVLEAAYRSSAYRDEISFAEYFAWTYHFLYTRTTDLLAHQGAIEIPPGGVATYVVE